MKQLLSSRTSRWRRRGEVPLGIVSTAVAARRAGGVKAAEAAVREHILTSLDPRSRRHGDPQMLVLSNDDEAPLQTILIGIARAAGRSMDPVVVVAPDVSHLGMDALSTICGVARVATVASNLRFPSAEQAAL